MGNKTHQRLAIGGATRSYNAGNISKSEELRIQGAARAKLGESRKSARDQRHAQFMKTGK